MKAFIATAFTAVLLAGAAHAETVTTTTRTVVQQQPIPPGDVLMNFQQFDLNGNGILSMPEVGEKLFYIFDTDGNEVIDNIEFNRDRVVTITPMEKITVKMVDIDSDGVSEASNYTYETFNQSSGLARFDGDLDGLSPADFIDTSFLALDTDSSKAIELDEWKKAYISSRAPLSADQDGYN